jgi:hypothetical protein
MNIYISDFDNVYGSDLTPDEPKIINVLQSVVFSRLHTPHAFHLTARACKMHVANRSFLVVCVLPTHSFINYVLDTDFKIDNFVILSEVVLNTKIGQNSYRTIFINYVLDTDFKIHNFVILSEVVLNTEIGQNPYLEPFFSITF